MLRLAPDNSRVNSLPSHDAYAIAPVFINIKTINLDVGRDGSGESGERRMEAQGGRDQIDQWRFVTDLAFTEQFGGADVAAASMGFDAPPVVDSLKDVFAIFVDLQFDHCQPAVVTQREEID